MKRSVSRVTLVSLTALTGAVGLAAPADAVTPQRESYHDHFVQVDDSFCGFPITFDYSRSVRSTVFFDRHGDPIAVRYHIAITGTDTAKGVTLQDTAVHNSLDNLLTGSETRTGIDFLVKLPRGGVISVGGGRVVVDADGNVTFEAGPHPFLDGNLDAYCAAFG
jgi:hypothetical protein